MISKRRRSLSSVDKGAYKSRCTVWCRIGVADRKTQPHIRDEIILDRRWKLINCGTKTDSKYFYHGQQKIHNYPSSFRPQTGRYDRTCCLCKNICFCQENRRYFEKINCVLYDIIQFGYLPGDSIDWVYERKNKSLSWMLCIQIFLNFNNQAWCH